MRYRVVLTGPAKQDLHAAHDWWALNRSAEQAARWYYGISAAIRTLSQSPERCSRALEGDLLPQGVRQLLFGMGKKPTHRIVFAIEDMTVLVFRVRHTSQDALRREELQQ